MKSPYFSPLVWILILLGFILLVALLVYIFIIPSSVNGNQHALSGDYQALTVDGNFVSLHVDREAKTITYQSIELNGVATFEIGLDGSLDIISDPNNYLVTGYEIPGYFLAFEVKTTTSKTLMLGVPRLSDNIKRVKDGIQESENHDNIDDKYNYMTFRHHSGGFEVGSATRHNDQFLHQSYWPLADTIGTVEELMMTNENKTLQSESGMMLLSMEDSAFICIKQSATINKDVGHDIKQFDGSTMAGIYSGISYSKTSAFTDQGNLELGDVILEKVTISISPNAEFNLNSTACNFSGSLQGWQDKSTINNFNLINTSGFYEASSTNAIKGTDSKVFVIFLDRGLLYGQFQTQQDGTSNYMYGVALLQN